jgi:hypothetical protein
MWNKALTLQETQGNHDVLHYDESVSVANELKLESINYSILTNFKYLLKQNFKSYRMK